ncbi:MULTISPECIES: type VII secretion protein EccCa [Amycolatopsis]|uniref:Type VII secretion protein EccCa n=1 Tax=Amycolatopsis albidoflavus TaxID=102226 RepID=A0ABW5I8M9_9PSEU
MSTIVISRMPRQPGPPMPEGQLELQEPPVLADAGSMGLTQAMTVLPMVLMGGAMALMYTGSGGGPSSFIGGGMMGVAMVSMMLGQLTNAAGARRSKMKNERRDYLRYLGQARDQMKEGMRQQRQAAAWDNPDPATLWSLSMGGRLWERRSGNEDFGEVRIGLGEQRSAIKLVPPQTKPVEDLEPLCAIALRRFIRAHSSVPGMPMALYLRGLSSVGIGGDQEVARGLLRALLAQLATFHAPDDLRIAVLTNQAASRQWEWAKWLPHVAHPSDVDAAGPVRLFATDHDELMGVLGTAFTERSAFDAGAVPNSTEPYLVVVADGAKLPRDSRFLAGGMRNAVLLEIGTREPGVHSLQLVAEPSVVSTVDEEGVESGLLAPDFLSLTGVETFARGIAPLRTAGGAVDSSEPLTNDFEMTRLLGIRDVRNYDVHALWRARSRSGKLRVPIGIGQDGSVVELDIKESAQGGMGPHGVLIGATGSGKSELLRTLVITMAVTHSSEVLNFVLVDFKGGATFLGLDELPHTSAVITNLADELPLVDRMQVSLHGELIRRQELLRQCGHSSLLEYEKARAAGSQLSPLPTLFIVVDEFSELLASKPEFMDLFVMIGRLGRSLGVHLLLASQRLDEGRIHQVEGHLSYRIALRTFSGMESRTVIGVTSAYELPAAPGNGYLKIDMHTLVRFKAGYVSGPVPAAPQAIAGRADGPMLVSEVVPFSLGYQAPAIPVGQPLAAGTAPVEPLSEEDEETLLTVLGNRLKGQGPPARQVWLPPLDRPPTLDKLLPGVAPDPRRGLTAGDWRGSGALRAPVGVIDRPFEQVRELLVADLAGGAGHVGVVGAPQGGKSTVLRTLVMSLALTHTPDEIQFYCLDFGGGALAAVSSLPHVGSVAARMDRDRVKRTVDEVVGLLELRERGFAENGVESMSAYRRLRRTGAVNDAFGDVFLVVDGWHTLRQEYEDLERVLSEVAARGLGYGIHIIASATRWSEIRPSLRDLLGTRYELRLGDPLESEVGSRAARGVPDAPGRGLTREGAHFFAALPRLDGISETEDLSEALKALVEDVTDFWPGDPAPGVRLLPPVLPASELPAPTGDVRVPLGLDERRLQPLVHDFETSPHLMVFGDAETGKTNVLRLVARAVMNRYQPDEAKLLLGDFRRDLYQIVPEPYRVGYAVSTDALGELVRAAETTMRGRLPGTDITPDRLRMRDWWTGARLFMLIDDYDLMTAGIGGPLDPLEPLLAQGADIGLHLIIARSTSGAMRSMMDPVLRRLWELGAPGVLLSYPKEEGKFLGEAVPRTLLPGRAQFVTRRSVQLVQTGYVDLAEDGPR